MPHTLRMPLIYARYAADKYFRRCRYAYLDAAPCRSDTMLMLDVARMALLRYLMPPPPPYFFRYLRLCYDAIFFIELMLPPLFSYL